MDQKISEMTSAAGLLAADLIPIVSGGVNKVISGGVLSQNLPHVGTTGIFKLVPAVQSGAAISLTRSTSVLPNGGAYTLASGTDGQVIYLLSQGVCTVQFNSVETASFTAKGTLTLLYVSSESSWFVLTARNVVLS